MLDLNNIIFNKWTGNLAGRCFKMPYLSYCHSLYDYVIYYTDEETSKVAKELKLVPDETGNIELYSKFWTDSLYLKNEHTAPPLVVYADLLGTGNNRNIEKAKLILENGL